MSNYLDSQNKQQCFGCEACGQICPKNAITFIDDKEGFRYPKIDENKCVHCGLCRKVCPYEKTLKKEEMKKYVFGGYHKDWKVRDESTSGGAFTAIVEAFCDENYVIFGAEAKGLKVFHSYVINKEDTKKYRKSKYSQSVIGDSYRKVKEFLNQGKKVLFSGTPCQIAGLKIFLQNTDITNLLTVEVVCEGVPSPLYVRKLEKHLQDKYGYEIDTYDYRFKDSHKRIGKPIGKWDFEVTYIKLKNNKKIKKDRWLNPYWQLWLRHLMSRPSCYHCQFTSPDRNADITLGDLWGVHLYCPELYGNNTGASLIIANTKKGKNILEVAKNFLYGHELDFNEAIKYQGPLKKSIEHNKDRDAFMKDLMDESIKYKDIIKKWYKKPDFKLLWSKYIWGNRQKIFVWNIKNRKELKDERDD